MMSTVFLESNPTWKMSDSQVVCVCVCMVGVCLCVCVFVLVCVCVCVKPVTTV